MVYKPDKQCSCGILQPDEGVYISVSRNPDVQHAIPAEYTPQFSQIFAKHAISAQHVHPLTSASLLAYFCAISNLCSHETCSIPNILTLVGFQSLNRCEWLLADVARLYLAQLCLIK